MRIIKDRYFVLLSLGIALGCFPLLSAVRTLAAPAPGPAPAAGAATNAAVVEDSLGRTTPQGTFLGFIRAAEKEEYRLASNYLEGKQNAADEERVAPTPKVLL